jgi:hypothetical protein
MTQAPTLQTPAQKHEAARQAQALSRLGGMLVLLVFLGVPAVLAGFVLFGFVQKNRRRLGMVAAGMLIGLVIVGLGYRTVLAEAKAIVQRAAPYQGALREWARKPNAEHWLALQPALKAVAPRLGRLWLLALPLAPLIALYLESTRIRNAREQREEQQRKEHAQDMERRRQATQKVKRAPEQIGGLAVIGVPFGGELGWTAKEWAIYSPQMLNRHAVIIGGSGTGKTEFILRVAYVARKVYGWKVFYIDAKGDPGTAQRFRAVMQRAGVEQVPVFPDQIYHGWVGDATTIFNRLMAVEDYSEPYYKAVAKTVLTLAVKAPSGPPRESTELLKRLHLDGLAALYRGEQSTRTEALSALSAEHVSGVQRRYFGFFDALGDKLDGGWSFDTADAGYLLLEGLALKEEARSLGRYLLEDFANYVARRKPSGQQILLIIDEFSALSAGGADAANLFERLRSFGAGIMVTSQTSESLGEDAKKLIGAAAVTIAFGCADPEPIAARAGRVKETQAALAVEYTATPGRNLLTSGKEQFAGTSMQREQEVFLLHPDTIRRLAVGECCIIANGAYQAIRVARLPEQASASRVKQPASTAIRPRGAAIAITPRSAPRPAQTPTASSTEQNQEGRELLVEELDLVRPAPLPPINDETSAEDRDLVRPGADVATQAAPSENHPAEESIESSTEVEQLQGTQAMPDREHDSAEPEMTSSTDQVTRPTIKPVVSDNDDELDI